MKKIITPLLLMVVLNLSACNKEMRVETEKADLSVATRSSAMDVAEESNSYILARAHK